MDLFEEFNKKSDSHFKGGFGDQTSSPLFSLKKLDWEKSTNKANKKNKSRVILRVATSNSVIVIATNGCSVLRWNLADGSKEPEEIEISSKQDDSIDHIFIDPTGNHIIVALKSFENYYLNSRAPKPKKISKLQGSIECIAFDRQQSTEISTKTFLVGTSNGMIYEMSLDNTGKEKVCNSVYQLEQPVPITSIYYEILSGSGTSFSDNQSGSGGLSGWSASATSALSNAVGQSAVSSQQSMVDNSTRYFVMCATSSPTRMYHFIGGPTLSQLFADYLQSGTTSFTELPGEIKRAELYCYSKNMQSRAQNFALMTEMGIYHGSLLFTNASTVSSGFENVLLEAQLLPFVPPQQKAVSTKTGSVSGESDSSVQANSSRLMSKPISIAVSEFHFLILLGDRLQVMSRLNGKLVQEEMLKAGEGVTLGMVRDTSARNAIWLYSTSSIFQIIVSGEDRYVSNIYLSKALTQGEEKLFDAALEYAKNKEQKNKIMRAQAEFSMNNGRPERAAVCFAQSDMAFDEVVLKLIHCGNEWKSAAVESHGAVDSNGLLNSKDLRGLLVTGGSELTPLRVYLTEVLKTLPLSSKSQRTMLCTWLCEVFLHQISVASIQTHADKVSGLASDSSIKNARSVGNNSGGVNNVGTSSAAGSNSNTEAELTVMFKDFLRTNKLSLDLSTTFSLIIGRNNRSLLLFFAQIAGDYHRVVSIYMTDREYHRAIQVLRDAPFEKVVSLIYKTAPVLIEAEPDATVNMLLSKPQLTVSGLLPAILRYSSALDRQLQEPPEDDSLVHRLDRDFDNQPVNFAIRFLREVLDRLSLGFDGSAGSSDEDTHYGQLSGGGMAGYANPEPVLFHTLVWLLAKYDDSPDESELVSLLSHMQELRLGGVFVGFDLDYGYMLRKCRLYKRPRSAVIGLLLLDAPEMAVREALLFDLALAQQIARAQKDSDVRKSLWLDVARHVIDTEADMQRPIALIQISDGVLSIDDLLPLLPDFTEMDLFNDEICMSLEDCGMRISALKAEMEELAETADSTVKELESMKNRAYSMSSQHQRCEYCVDPLFGKQFYLFPCSHGFHSQCLLKRAAIHLQPAQLSAVRGIEDVLKGLSGRVKDSDNRARAQQEALQMELDGYIAADCPLCGYVMIQSLSRSLISDEDLEEAKSWDLLT